MGVDHRPHARVVAVYRAVEHTLARRCIRGIADRVSLEIDAHQHVWAKRPLEGRIGCDPQLVFARDAHTHVAARRSDESVRVHFLDGANDLVANITDEDSTRIGDRAAWSGRSKRPRQAADCSVQVPRARPVRKPRRDL